MKERLPGSDLSITAPASQLTMYDPVSASVCLIEGTLFPGRTHDILLAGVVLPPFHIERLLQMRRLICPARPHFHKLLRSVLTLSQATLISRKITSLLLIFAIHSEKGLISVLFELRSMGSQRLLLICSVLVHSFLMLPGSLLPSSQLHDHRSFFFLRIARHFLSHC